jgi:hypothetical protein
MKFSFCREAPIPSIITSAMKKSILLASLLLICFPAWPQLQPHETQVNIIGVKFTGAESVPEKERTEIALDIQSSVTQAGQLGDEMGERIRDGFQRHGYFKAQVSPPTVTILGGNKRRQSVAVEAKVDAGPQYRLGAIAFTGATVFDPVRLRAAVPMQSGETFSVEGMRQGLKNMRELYCDRGYINFTPVPNTDIDEEHLLINVTFDMDEGAEFRVGKLVLNGEEPFAGAGKKMLEVWHEHEGEVYDCRWPENLFTPANVGPRLASIIRGGYPKALLDNENHRVNLVFDFPDPPTNARLTPSPH